MELKHLRYFIAAVEEGSLQGAAARLNIAQPALSRRVRDLEAELGCALFERSVRGVVPTAAGTSLYRDGVAFLDELGEAAQRARRLGLEQDRNIRIGLAPVTTRKYGFLQDALARFIDRQPASGIAFSRGSSAELLSALRAGQLDIALLYEQHAASPHLAQRLIHRERFVLAVHPSHPLAGKAAPAISDLAGEKLVWLSRHDLSDRHNPLLQEFHRHGLEPLINQLVESPEEQMDLVAVGAGLCLTPASTMLTVSGGQVAFRALADFAMELDFSMVWRRDPASGAVSGLLDALETVIDSHQHELRRGETAWARLDGSFLLSLEA